MEPTKQNDDELIDFKFDEQTTPEEEANLAEFLKKVSVACNNDKSVPDSVGSQVMQWLQELESQPQPDEDVSGDCGGSK